ncbi:g protein-coupled receptor [Anaeramoeba flamelloides]|uniref:G protein-coupled receptor n=1 Tax=Anaeramoeba flamelloides TaxID=1746091 RepID=A0ABQ8ZB25_9EUKA|nr:g protein-coupled receptor [Anaeramoeba flamelloides]
MNLDKLLATVSALISLIGSILIFSLNARFKEYRQNFFRRLIFHLSVYDILQTFIFLFPFKHSGISCSVQGYYLVFNAHMPPHFSSIISYLTWLSLARNEPLFVLKRRYKYLHVFSFVLTAVTTIVIGTQGKFQGDPVTEWCFISDDKWILIFYIFLWIDILISMTFYFLIIKKIHDATKIIRATLSLDIKERRTSDLRIQIQLSLIPLILLITLFFPSYRRIRQFIQPESKGKYIKWLNICHHLFNPLQGFLDFVVFVLCSKYSRQKLKEMLTCKTKKNTASQFNQKLLPVENLESVSDSREALALGSQSGSQFSDKPNSNSNSQSPSQAQSYDVDDDIHTDNPQIN